MKPVLRWTLIHGWRFRQADGLSDVPSSAFDDSQWTMVDVPHTWNRIGSDGTERSALTNAVQGVGWYRLRFKTPASSAMRRYFLQFDGVGAIADVWLNGHYLGKHAGAFSRFRFDASTVIKPSGENLLVVRADNSRPQPGSSTENVIPLSGDFFVFGGIYRGVALIATDPVHVDMLDYGGPGLYARTETRDPSSAAVRVSAKLVNDGSKPRTVMVGTRIEGDAKVIVASQSSRVSVAPMQPVTIDHTLHVGRPRLWQGVKDPYLYELIVTVRSSQGRLLDRVVQPLGVRSLSIDADKGLSLNGEHLFLKGASMHQDRPVKGWAISHVGSGAGFRAPARHGRKCRTTGPLSARSVLLRVGGCVRDRGLGGNPLGQQSVVRRLVRERGARRQRPAAAHRADPSELQSSVDCRVVDCQ